MSTILDARFQVIDAMWVAFTASDALTGVSVTKYEPGDATGDRALWLSHESPISGSTDVPLFQSGRVQGDDTFDLPWVCVVRGRASYDDCQLEMLLLAAAVDDAVRNDPGLAEVGGGTGPMVDAVMSGFEHFGPVDTDTGWFGGFKATINVHNRLV